MRSRIMKRNLTAVAALGTLFIATVQATPAVAARASAPTITFSFCSTVGSVYRMTCEAQWVGGTDPATARWTNAWNTWIGPGDYNSATRRTWVDGNCVPGAFFAAKVTITDAAGAVTEKVISGGRACVR
ncbi:hypothetical protein ACIBEJ_13885 [Nonomuraea sp. NPDC050790]|uniref:hypothetical protein n=1 Tax=Nonomuraea sp. NPDC050790 TaxID=3364371 RepID=UPI0037BBFFD4